MTYSTCVIFFAPAILEIGADAIIRKGLRERGLAIVIAECIVLSSGLHWNA
jgi:hypothetical protein